MTEIDGYTLVTQETATAVEHTVLVDLFYVEDEAPLRLRQPLGKACRVFGGATCSQGCSLVGGRLLVATADGEQAVNEKFVANANNVAKTSPFTLRMPEQLGESTWKLSYIPPALPLTWQKMEREPRNTLPTHERVDYDLEISVVPHSLGVSVSGFRSPLPVGSDFDIVVGAKCSGNCNLGGLKVVVLDADSAYLASARLSETGGQTREYPLYSATVAMRTPAEPGIYRWIVRVYGDALKLAHADVEQSFFFTAIDNPFRKIQVVVADMETSESVHQASVSFVHGGWLPFEQRTDEHGVAEIQIPDGEYQISIAKVGYPINRVTVFVSENKTLFEIPLRGEDMGG
ncbi:MAG: hypothetical protein LBK67_04750 [Coriobacteriales bacterium]|jgi:hypothetical protein|nr:hypothetical protein [Coriobacteriales bacterium]